MASTKISTYFSHSYRIEDQKCNAYFWEILDEEGFFFSVDPPSDITTHTHLERMMIESSCYVAVVNVRDGVPKHRCSPFILSEFGLSVQAQRPRLLLVDKVISGSKLFSQLPRGEVLPFSADPLLADKAELRRAIRTLKRGALRLGDPELRERGPIGILVPREDADRAYGGCGVRREIRDAADLHGFDWRELPIPDQHNAAFALKLRECEAVVLDVRGDTLPPWVFAYVYGRLVPSIKLVHLNPKELSSLVELPPLVKGLQMDHDEPGVESVVYWREPNDLLYQLRAAFKKLSKGPTRFKEQHQGLSYFDSIGRRPARVFISNSGTANRLAGALVRKLTLNNIDTFHYKEEDAIKIGTNWDKAIRTEVQSCDVFVALINQGYSESRWCRKEFEIAKKREQKGEVALLPFNLHPMDSSFQKAIYALLKEYYHAPDLDDEEVAAVGQIFKAIDTELKDRQSSRNWEPRQPLPLGASREAVIDALRHLPKEAWTVLVDRLAQAQIEVPIWATQRRMQPREIVEEVVFAVQRAEITSELAEERMSPLSRMVRELASVVPDDRRKPILQGIVERMQKSFNTPQ